MSLLGAAYETSSSEEEEEEEEEEKVKDGSFASKIDKDREDATRSNSSKRTISEYIKSDIGDRPNKVRRTLPSVASLFGGTAETEERYVERTVRVSPARRSNHSAVRATDRNGIRTHDTRKHSTSIAPTSSSRHPIPFVPPQLRSKRPNAATEDVAKCRSDRANRRMKAASKKRLTP